MNWLDSICSEHGMEPGWSFAERERGLCSKNEQSQANEVCSPRGLCPEQASEVCQNRAASNESEFGALNLSGELPNYFNGDDPLRQVDRRESSPGDRKTFEVSKLWDTHHEIIRRLLLGQKSSEIAADLDVSRAMVSYVKNSKIVKEKLELMRGARDAETVDLAKEIRERAPVALKLLSKVIEGEIDAPITTRAREANNWLDRAGYGAVKTVQAQHVHAHFSTDEIEAIKRRAVENGFARPSKLNENLINVTPKSVESELNIDDAA